MTATRERIGLSAILQSPPIRGYYLTVCLRCHPYYERADIMAVYRRFCPASA